MHFTKYMTKYKFILQSLLYSDLVLYVQTTDKRFAFSGLDALGVRWEMRWSQLSSNYLALTMRRGDRA
jgi:hypothetical protein